MINPLLSTYINRHLNEATVILSFKILLQNCINNGAEATLTKTEIETEFNAVHDQYGIATFRRDYVLRQCGMDDSAIAQQQDNFYLKPAFIENMGTDDFQEALNTINEHWGGFQGEQRQIITELEDVYLSDDIQEKREYIIEMLRNRETVRRGQAFEVTSFAILRTYLSALGFDLNRFSTTYSNDGGIDFAAQSAVYQVTTKLNQRMPTW